MPTTELEQPDKEELARRWATILATDVVGYTRLMGDDPAATVEDLDIVRAIVKAHTERGGGYIADTAGDAIIGVFDTAIGAVIAAMSAQREIEIRAESKSEDRKMLLRMGIHIGDILEKSDGTVYGDGVNIAARIEGLAPVSGVAVSDKARLACGEIKSVKFVDQGEFDAKNVKHRIRVHVIYQEDEMTTAGSTAKISRSVTKGNLPVRASGLIGRSDALEELKDRLQSSRLVTLHGTGGLGKTSLSIETAHLIGSDYPDGAWFADLAAVSEADAVAMAIAGIFGVTQQSGKTIEESLVEALRGRQMLLIFDNCEHVIKTAATLANLILTNCPKISIIATSREQLSISGEHVMHVAPLEVSGATAPAIELFTQRALAVFPDFDIDMHHDSVQEICKELDGIPLAIELAAARIRSMTPPQILERLAQRFRLLTGGSRAVRERHQTLRNAVQWSYDLLTDNEALVLDRASVFSGGFTLAAAEYVCSGGQVEIFDVVDVIDSLVSKSLLTVTNLTEGLRYGILESIRVFAAERLKNSEEVYSVHKTHSVFYADQSDENFKLWRSPQQVRAHEWLDLEINNLRDAFRWANQNGEVDPAARIASSVGDMARFRLREEAANWAEEVVEAARMVHHPRLAVLLTWCASSAWAFGRFDDAQKFGDEALSLLDNDAYEAFVWAYGDLAFVAIFSGNVDKAIELLSTGAEHPADSLDRFMMAFHLYIMATAGHADKALEIADEVVKLVDAAGVPMSIAVVHAARGAALEASDPQAALVEYEFAIDVASESGVTFLETLIAPRLADLHASSGDPMAALKGFERMLLSYGDASDLASVTAWRIGLVILFARTRQYYAAATLHGTLVGQVDQGSVAPEQEAAIKRIRAALGAKAFTDATVAGAGLSLREATNFAIAQVQLGLEAPGNMMIA